MCSTKYLLRLLDGVFGLAGNKQRCQSNILISVLMAWKPHAELMIIYRGSIKCPDRSVLGKGKQWMVVMDRDDSVATPDGGLTYNCRL